MLSPGTRCGLPWDFQQEAPVPRGRLGGGSGPAHAEGSPLMDGQLPGCLSVTRWHAATTPSPPFPQGTSDVLLLLHIAPRGLRAGCHFVSETHPQLCSSQGSQPPVDPRLLTAPPHTHKATRRKSIQILREWASNRVQPSPWECWGQRQCLSVCLGREQRERPRWPSVEAMGTNPSAPPPSHSLAWPMRRKSQYPRKWPRAGLGVLAVMAAGLSSEQLARTVQGPGLSAPVSTGG